MAKKVIKTKIYTVDCIRNGFCYCTHTECTWEDVKRLKEIARLLGETIALIELKKKIIHINNKTKYRR